MKVRGVRRVTDGRSVTRLRRRHSHPHLAFETRIVEYSASSPLTVGVGVRDVVDVHRRAAAAGVVARLLVLHSDAADVAGGLDADGEVDGFVEVLGLIGVLPHLGGEVRLQCANEVVHLVAVALGGDRQQSGWKM